MCAAEHLSPKLHGSTCPQSGVPTAVRCRARQLHGSEVVYAFHFYVLQFSKHICSLPTMAIYFSQL